MFVAATMPGEGKKSTAAELREAFPEAVWLSGARLHQAQRRVRHCWVPIWSRRVGERARGESLSLLPNAQLADIQLIDVRNHTLAHVAIISRR